MRQKTFVESDHPRARTGKFTNKAAPSAPAYKPPTRNVQTPVETPVPAAAAGLPTCMAGMGEPDAASAGGARLAAAATGPAARKRRKGRLARTARLALCTAALAASLIGCNYDYPEEVPVVDGVHQMELVDVTGGTITDPGRFYAEFGGEQIAIGESYARWIRPQGDGTTEIKLGHRDRGPIAHATCIVDGFVDPDEGSLVAVEGELMPPAEPHLLPRLLDCEVDVLKSAEDIKAEKIEKAEQAAQVNLVRVMMGN